MAKRNPSKSNQPAGRAPSRGVRNISESGTAAGKGRNPAITLSGPTVTSRTSTGRSAGRGADLSPPPAPTARTAARKSTGRIRRDQAHQGQEMPALRKQQLEAEASIQDVTEAPESGTGRGEWATMDMDQDESGAQGLSEPKAGSAAEQRPEAPRRQQPARPKRRPRA